MAAYRSRTSTTPTAAKLLPGNPAYQSGLEVIAYLYNRSIERHGENRAIYTQKDRSPAYTASACSTSKRASCPALPPSPGRPTPA